MHITLHFTAYLSTNKIHVSIRQEETGTCKYGESSSYKQITRWTIPEKDDTRVTLYFDSGRQAFA